MSGEPLPDRPSRLPAHHRLILAALRQREARHCQVLWSPVDPGGPFLTLISRLSDLAEALHQTLAPLRLDHPRQHHYPAGDLHVTLVNLDHIAGDERAVTAVTAAARNVGPLHLLFAAPSVSRQTVYLPGVEITGQLRRLRRQTRAAAGVRPHPLDRVRDDLVFANLVRFQAPLTSCSCGATSHKCLCRNSRKPSSMRPNSSRPTRSSRRRRPTHSPSFPCNEERPVLVDTVSPVHDRDLTLGEAPSAAAPAGMTRSPDRVVTYTHRS